MATIILTGGGTAGHCTPHLAILPYIKNDFDKIYYIGSENGIEKNIVSQTGIPYFAIPCAKLNRKLCLSNLTLPFKIIKGINKAGKLIDKLKPDIIFSKGGYVSLPTVIAANKRKIPIIAHESDLTPGIANKISSKYCKKVLTSFPQTAKYFINGEYIGSPIRKSIFNTNTIESLKSFGFSNSKPILLITGGSQGAETLNDITQKTLNQLLERFNVIHICGKGKIKQEEKHKGYFQTEYMNKIENAFNVCDICVTRAGSNTVFELLSLKKPCLLIPLPKGNSRGDQVDNAKYFQKQGLVNVLEQDVLTPESFLYNVNALYDGRKNLLKNLEKHPVKDCSRQISRIIADTLN